MNADENWVFAASADILGPGQMLAVKVGDLDVAVYNVDGTYYATDNVCSHAFALLSDGFLDGDVVECPLHAGAFDVRSGKAVCAPAVHDIKTYQTRVVGAEIHIRTR